MQKGQKGQKIDKNGKKLKMQTCQLNNKKLTPKWKTWTKNATKHAKKLPQ